MGMGSVFPQPDPHLHPVRLVYLIIIIIKYFVIIINKYLYINFNILLNC